MLDVRRWAEIRRMKEVEGLSIREIVRRTGHDRNTIRRALRREGPPRYQPHHAARPRMPMGSVRACDETVRPRVKPDDKKAWRCDL